MVYKPFLASSPVLCIIKLDAQLIILLIRPFTWASCDPESTNINYLLAIAGRQTTMTIPASTAFSGNENLSTTDLTSFPTASSSDFSSVTNYDYLNYEDYTGDFGICVYERQGATFLPVLYSIFFLLGLLGNSLVIWVIACGVRLRSMTDVCLLNLAISDLLLVCSLPFLAHQARDQWLFGDPMCKVVLGIYHIVFYCGIFFISLMSVDRYLAIVHAVYAMRARTRSFGVIAAAITWAAGFLASFPDVLFLKQQIVWRLLYSQSSKKQAIRLVFIVVAVFFCCWVPYNVALFFQALELLNIYMGCESSKAIRLTLQVTEAIAYSHSCLNPFLYVFVGEKFRRHLLRLINRTPCRLCQVIKVYIPQDRLAGSVYSQTTSIDERGTAV
ncbi:C-C chemokine receptor type 4 isoform X2 [Lates calcarifer]|uniref:C-C chemokine receptor type 4 isoform X2 n=1 Tax=Lates calcarifer TaxID=8187 RepID=A0AAJ8BI53_LATCA|nr:C-C chemokine receptor type 4 isoform X2 [Lates calcarifer]